MASLFGASGPLQAGTIVAELPHEALGDGASKPGQKYIEHDNESMFLVHFALESDRDRSSLAFPGSSVLGGDGQHVCQHVEVGCKKDPLSRGF